MVYKEIDSLSVKQLMRIQNLIEQMKAEEQDTTRSGKDWMEQIAIPTLKEFAENRGAMLEITEEEKETVLTLSELTGFDTGNLCRKLKTVLLLAADISVEADEDRLRIYLTYEPKDFII